MFYQRFFAALVFLWLFIQPAAAQDKAVLSLQAPGTALQTGQEYVVNIQLDGVSELWVANVEISYDPSLLYIIGTKAGSPVKGGTLFDASTSVVIRNTVQQGTILYTTSLLAPANPGSGNGTIGTFRVYPLKAGTTRLSFTKAVLTRVTFSGEGDNRVGSNPQPIAFAPVYLEVTLSGDTVEPPSEATATPAPTETPGARGGPSLATGEPTLVNLAAAPTIQVTAVPTAASEAPSSNSPLLIGAVAIMVIAGIGLLILLVVWRRRR
jgi:hypothetical protein